MFDEYCMTMIYCSVLYILLDFVVLREDLWIMPLNHKSIGRDLETKPDICETKKKVWFCNSNLQGVKGRKNLIALGIRAPKTSFAKNISCECFQIFVNHNLNSFPPTFFNKPLPLPHGFSC